MAIPITNVSPSTVPLDGGPVITLTGTFPVGDLAVYVGPIGDDTDEQCYSGVIGEGNVIESADLTTLTAVVPAVARGGHKVSVYSAGDSGVWAGTLQAVEHGHLTGVYEIRKSLAPWVDTGARDMYLEPRQDQGASYDLGVKSPTRSTLETIGVAIAEHYGFRMTRLRTVIVAGAVELPVESVEGFDASGILWIGNEPVSVSYTGVDLTQTAQKFTGVVGVTLDHREETEVMDANRTWSHLDNLRRALLVDYADGSDLSRIGRRHGMTDQRGYSDATYRELIKAMAYLERGPIYSLEQVLDVIFPLGGYEIYESLIENPLQVEIRIPGAVGSDPAGRCFMQARDQSALPLTTQMVLTNAPIMVEKVVAPFQEQTADMSVLPSAIAAPYTWTYVPELVGAEAAFFSIVAGVLNHVAPGTNNSGRYRRTINELGTTLNRMDAAWKWNGLTVINGHPWKMLFRDGQREYALMWSQTQAYLGQFDGTFVSAVHTFAAPLTAVWQYPTLIREGNTIKAFWNGIEILSEQSSSFAASAAYRVSFGFWNTGAAQRWSVEWGWLRVATKNDLNLWNLRRADGVLAIGSPLLNSAAGAFLAAHANKLIRFVADEPENVGLWRIVSFNTPNQVEVDGVLREDAYTDVLNPDRLYSHSPRFDVAESKSIIITAGPNAGTYAVAEVVSLFQVRLTGAAFVTEVGTEWKFNPAGFVNEVGVPFEIVDAGTVAGATITLPDAVPALPFTAEAHYTTVLSGQVLRNETIENTGADYWPFYVTGVNERIQRLLDEVTVAGVIPKFNVIY